MAAKKVRAGWIYAFMPGFDPRSIKHVSIGEFTGKTPEAATLAGAVRPYLRSRLDDAGVPEPTATDDPATMCIMTGSIIEDKTIRDKDGEIQSRLLVAEARIQQGGHSIGAIQIYTRLPRHQGDIIPAPGAPLIGSLIARALEPDIADTKTAAERLGVSLASPFYQVRHDGSQAGKSLEYEMQSSEPMATPPSRTPSQPQPTVP